MEIKLQITETEYPLLFQLKEQEFEKTVKNIFSVGYSILYPKIDNLDKNVELLRNEINNQVLNEKISSLGNSLEKLIGLSTSSSKKGDLAENILENIFNQRYGDIQFKDMSHIPHSGDAWLTLTNDKIIMLESKNYTTVVNKDEVIKMQNDMITNHIKWGLFVSFNSNIQGMKEIDFHIFNHNNENYHILMISNLSFDIARLDLGLVIVRKLLNTYSDLQNFPWIINNIKSELDHLIEILEQNYLLRDNFISMEKDIIKNINTFYTKLRDYQFIMDNKIKDIVNKITSTMTDSIVYEKLDYTEFINQATNKDKKLTPIATKIADTLKKKCIAIINNELKIKDTHIATIKLQNKKISIELISYDIILNFNIGKDKEINQNLVILENLNL